VKTVPEIDASVGLGGGEILRGILFRESGFLSDESLNTD
jgi:hypothetical protein